jgi:hypothetical protein
VSSLGQSISKQSLRIRDLRKPQRVSMSVLKKEQSKPGLVKATPNEETSPLQTRRSEREFSSQVKFLSKSVSIDEEP